MDILYIHVRNNLQKLDVWEVGRHPNPAGKPSEDFTCGRPAAALFKSFISNPSIVLASCVVVRALPSFGVMDEAEREAAYGPALWGMYALHFLLAFDFFIIAPTLYLVSLLSSIPSHRW